MTRSQKAAAAAPPEKKPAGDGAQRRPVRPLLLVQQTLRLPERTAEDREFLPAALAIVEEPTSPIRVAFLYALCALLVTALLWSYFGHLDVYAVASGKIEAPGRTKVIQPLQSGKVLTIKANDGQKVRAGEVLIELDPTEAQASRTAAAAALANTRAEIARLRVEIAAARAQKINTRPTVTWPADIPQDVRRREQAVLETDLAKLAANLDQLGAQRKEKIAERDKYKANIAATKSLINSLSSQLAMTDQMKTEGWSSEFTYLQRLNPVLQAKESEVSLEGELATAEQDILVMDAQIVQTLQTFLASQTSQLASDERNIDQLEQTLVKATAQLGEMTLRAPIDGTVQASAVTTIGQVVTTGQQLMNVVPDRDRLQIEAYVLNEDIGFVKAGQPVNIKIDAFPYSRYGSIDGTVVQLANDAIPGKQGQQQQMNGSQPPSSDGAMSITTAAQSTQDLVYPVIISPAQTWMTVDGKQIPLVSGMTLTAEIKTERRRVISYILSPLIDVLSTAGHER
ncbi:MAG: HlyD family type I secretion periplasmic adaptor subunit [Bradyrhizobium sp.]|nr:HlyD family type I secretion periplasmic adaptor subunit [Bradyrhizobium sp.]